MEEKDDTSMSGLCVCRVAQSCRVEPGQDNASGFKALNIWEIGLSALWIIYISDSEDGIVRETEWPFSSQTVWLQKKKKNTDLQ